MQLQFSLSKHPEKYDLNDEDESIAGPCDHFVVSLLASNLWVCCQIPTKYHLYASNRVLLALHVSQ